jgi:hypothetical protein
VASMEGNGRDNVMSLAGRSGSDVSARLLLALTALYVERTIHTEEEQGQYAELALRLIERVDAATKAAVRSILRDHGLAPAAVCERLDALEGAAAGGAASLPPDFAGLRQPPDAGVPSDHAISTAVAVRESVAPMSHSMAPFVIPVGHAPAQQLPDELAPRPADATANATPAELAKAFFAAAPTERQSILSRIEGDPDAGPALDPVEATRRCAVLDIAAMEGRIGEFIREFERLLGVPKSLCERIVNDSSGEPMVVAAKAVNMPAAVLQRILLLVNPAVGRSVQRVFHLTDLFHDLDRATAVKLLSLWSADAPPNPEVRIDVSARKPRETGAAGMPRRFDALVERIGDIRRSVPESAVRRDHRSR